MYAMTQQSYPAYPAQQQQQQQQRQQQLQPAPPPARTYSGHGTSSAFSPSANPDEDWTKISDLAERRRIQNRIAQRNYRKKLKKRLEDLERRAGTSDDGSATGSEKSSSQPSKTSTSKRASPSSKKSATSSPSSRDECSKTVTQTFSPPMAEDEYFLQGSYEERERSHTPPMFSSYSAYPPPPEDMVPLPYGSGSSAPQTGPSYRAEYTSDYSAAGVPVTLPPMNHFSDAVKREHASYGGASEDAMYMHYHSYLPSIEMAGAPSAYDTSNPHTPLLSHSWDHSTSCSDSGSYGEAYPTTPLSMPASPYMVAQQI